jgi:hypothetical protein
MARGLQTLQVITILSVASIVILGYAAGAELVKVASHIQWGFLVALLVAFTHSMTLFYLIGSSGNVREAVRPHGWKEYQVEMASFHRVLSPWLTFAILAAILAVLTGGGAHTRLWPAWVHQGTALLTLLFNLMAAWKGFAVISSNERLQGRLDAALREAERSAGNAS